MNWLVEVGLSNALMATALALVAGGVGLVVRRRPALVHGMWVLVLLRLLAPPLLGVPVGPFSTSPTPRTSAEPTPVEPLAGGPSRLVLAPAIATGAAPRAPHDSSESERDQGFSRSEAWAGRGELPVFPTRARRNELAPPLAALPTPPEVDLSPAPLEAVPDLTRPRSAPDAVAPPRPTPLEHLDWRRVVATIWLGGSLAWLGCVVVRVRRFRRALRCASEASESIQDRAEFLAGRLGLSRAPGVWIVPGAVAPMVWGLGRKARLILPGTLWGRLDDDQRDALLLHELAHLRRRDPWVRLLEMAVTGLYWWHPVAWWARRALREAEEACCDAWVVWATGPGSGRAYATALVEAVEFLSQARPALPPAASGMSRVRHLSRRIIMIMKGTTPRSLSWLGLLLLVALGVLTLTWLPIWAQPGQPTGLAPVAALTSNPEAITPIQNEVAILEAQLAQKRAALRGAEAARKIAQAKLDRLKTLESRRPDLVASAELAEVEAQVEIAEAEADARRAEVQEYEIRLRGAQQLLGIRTIPKPAASGSLPRYAAYPPKRVQPDANEAETTTVTGVSPANQTVQNLKQTGLAIHTYLANATNHLPPSITATDGTPLLSWRVAILPYLDQNELYQKFKLDEPWNSPHNLALLEEMPEVYATRNTGYPGLTFLAALVGPETAWGEHGGEGIRLHEIRDGTSNTLAVVESSFPIPWTSPQDILIPRVTTGPDSPPIRPVPPVPPLGGPDSRETSLLFLDGSVRTLTKPINPTTFHALTTRDGGEVVSTDQQGQLVGFVNPSRSDDSAPEGHGDMMGMMSGYPGMGMSAYGGMMGGPPAARQRIQEEHQQAQEQYRKLQEHESGAEQRKAAPPGMESMMSGAYGGMSGDPGMGMMMGGAPADPSEIHPYPPHAASGMEAMMGGGGGMMSGMGSAGPAQPSDRDRLDALEKKLDRLLEAVESLQRERGGQGEAPSDVLPLPTPPGEPAIDAEPTLPPPTIDEPLSGPPSAEPGSDLPPSDRSPFDLAPPSPPPGDELSSAGPLPESPFEPEPAPSPGGEPSSALPPPGSDSSPFLFEPAPPPGGEPPAGPSPPESGEQVRQDDAPPYDPLWPSAPVAEAPPLDAALEEDLPSPPADAGPPSPADDSNRPPPSGADEFPPPPQDLQF